MKPRKRKIDNVMRRKGEGMRGKAEAVTGNMGNEGKEENWLRKARKKRGRRGKKESWC